MPKLEDAIAILVHKIKMLRHEIERGNNDSADKQRRIWKLENENQKLLDRLERVNASLILGETPDI